MKLKPVKRTISLMFWGALVIFLRLQQLLGHVTLTLTDYLVDLVYADQLMSRRSNWTNKLLFRLSLKPMKKPDHGPIIDHPEWNVTVPFIFLWNLEWSKYSRMIMDWHHRRSSLKFLNRPLKHLVSLRQKNPVHLKEEPAVPKVEEPDN